MDNGRFTDQLTAHRHESAPDSGMSVRFSDLARLGLATADG
jgi:hypothetical protein